MYLEDVQKCENVTLEEYIVPKLIEIKFIHKLYMENITIEFENHNFHDEF